MATTNQVLNLNTATRGQAVNFVELVPVASLGPVGQAASTTTTPNVNAVIWSIVPNMTQDLKTAIIGFINKDKNGKTISQNLLEGRTKVIEFEFQGTPSNIYKFGELGLVTIKLSYPPGSNVFATLLTSPSLNTTGLIASQTGGINPSDLRLKNILKKIRTTDSGINIYSFTYKKQFGIEGVYQGVVAQELIGTPFEDALVKVGDYFYVNYYKLKEVDFCQIA